MFCQHFSYNLCTKASLVDSKPHFFQPCQIFCSLVGIGVSLRVEECEGSRHVHMLLLFQIADDDMLINIFTTFPGSASATGVISVSKAIMLPLQGELWHVFSLKQQTEIERLVSM